MEGFESLRSQSRIIRRKKMAKYKADFPDLAVDHDARRWRHAVKKVVKS